MFALLDLKHFRILLRLLGLGPLLCPAASPAQQVPDPVQWVNPQIGTISHLLTSTTAEVYLPHSMMHIAPLTVADTYDKFLARRVLGFPAGNASFMPVSGNYGGTPDSCSSSFDRDFEVVKPYYLFERLERGDISCEAASRPRSAAYRVKFSESRDNYLVLFLQGKSSVLHADAHSVTGWNERNGARIYFFIRFLQPVELKGRRGDSAVIFALKSGKNLDLNTGISYISAAQAAANLAAEIGERSLSVVAKLSRSDWNRQLGKIAVTGGDRDQRAIFYTSMYRALNSMQDISEGGSYFSIFDGKIHADSRPFYTCDGLWDSHRVKHPLQLLLDPGQQADMLQSYARMYRQYGTMPLFPFPQGELTYMIGNHLAAFTADAWFKGCRNFDLQAVYEGLRKNALEETMLPDRNGPKTSLDDFYQAHGYFPALNETDLETVEGVHPFYRRQAVSVTLEFSYDDYCMSLLAGDLGLPDDVALFRRRAANYSNLFNPQTGFMSPKLADGSWVTGFNPMTSGRQAGRDYFTECNSWVYSFSVQHDVAGLIRLYGSQEAFTAKLDSLFEAQYPGYKFEFLEQFPDMTGLIGMYSQGNEPAFHIPYLYCYAGQPWKTQRVLRQIMQAWYMNNPMGLCGDDDDGALSSWYVFSSLGFYPVCPGRPYYVIGSPLFSRSDIHLSNGKTFSIIAKKVSKQNKYIQSAILQGKRWDKPWFSHAQMMEGGTLILTMGPQPNRQWGSRPEDAPPSAGLAEPGRDGTPPSTTK